MTRRAAGFSVTDPHLAAIARFAGEGIRAGWEVRNADKAVAKTLYRPGAVIQSGPIIVSAHRTTALMPSIGRVG